MIRLAGKYMYRALLRKHCSINWQVSCNTVGVIIMMFAQWLISVILVRISDYGTAGIFSLSMSISNVFYAIQNYQLRNYQLADINNIYSKLEYRLTRWVLIILGIIFMGIYSLFNNYTVSTNLSIFIYLLYSSSYMISDTLLIPVQIEGHLEITGYSNFIRAIASFTFFVLSFVYSQNLNIALLFMTFGSLIVVAFFDYPIFADLNKSKETYQIINIFRILISAFGLFLATILPMLTTGIVRASIVKYFGESILGYYSSIMTPTVLITTAIPAIITSLLPMLIESRKNNLHKYIKYIIVLYIGITVFGLLLFLFSLVLGKLAMALVFGQGILEYYDLLYSCILVTCINAFILCGNGVLTAIHKKNYVATSSAICVLIVYILTKLIIPKGTIYMVNNVLLIAYIVNTIIHVIVIIIDCVMERRRIRNEC